MDRELVLAQFSKKKRLAVKGYEHFVKERAGQGHVKEFYELKDQLPGTLTPFISGYQMAGKHEIRLTDLTARMPVFYLIWLILAKFRSIQEDISVNNRLF